MAETAVAASSTSSSNSSWSIDSSDGGAVPKVSASTNDATSENTVSAFVDEAVSQPPLAQDSVDKVLTEVSSSFRDASGHGRSSAYTWVGAGGHATSHSARQGVTLTAEASAGVSLGAGAGAETEVHGTAGEAGANINISLWVGAEVRAHVRVDPTRLVAGAESRVGVMNRSEANAHATAFGGLARAQGAAEAEAGAGAKARGTVTASYLPVEAAFVGKAGVFAGARASFSASAGAVGLGVGIAGQAWAGAGAVVDVGAGIKDGTWELTVGLGLAIGVGVFLKVHYEVNLKPITKVFDNVGAFIDDLFAVVGSLFDGGKGDGTVFEQVISSVTTLLHRLSENNDTPESASEQAASASADASSASPTGDWNEPSPEASPTEACA